MRAALVDAEVVENEFDKITDELQGELSYIPYVFIFNFTTGGFANFGSV